MFSNSISTTRRVLLVTAGECRNPIPAEVLMASGIEWLMLAPSEAIEFLQAEPFGVTAVVVAAQGESLAAHELVAALKTAARRAPIVFLDGSRSSVSEVRIRRTGVHYYTHIPVSAGEISAVLDGLSACNVADSPLAARSAS